METQNWCWPLQEMGKVAVAPQKCVLEQNFQLLTPIKFGSPGEGNNKQGQFSPIEFFTFIRIPKATVLRRL